jgi:hypothetical protein
VSNRTEGCRNIQTKSLCIPLSAVGVRMDTRRSGKGPSPVKWWTLITANLAPHAI